MKTLATLTLAAALVPFAGAWAQQAAPADHSAHHAGAGMAEGEVRKVDKEAGKVTLRHGPIQNLDMPPMTMVFQAADPALLDRVKAGDKVRFSAVQDGGAYIVNAIEPVR